MNKMKNYLHRTLSLLRIRADKWRKVKTDFFSWCNSP